MTTYIYSDITEKIIQCFYTVDNSLGNGFLEKVYEKALSIELRRAGLQIEVQCPIKVYYQNEIVGEYFADIIVNDSVIVELKAIDSLNAVHGNQLVNYLKATGIEVGLLLNFGPKPEIKRKIYTTS